MTSAAPSLPAYLSDLTLTLGGTPLGVHRVPGGEAPSSKRDWVQFGFGTPRYWGHGLVVDLSAGIGEVRTSCTLDRYSGGEVTHHSQWDDAESGPSTTDAPPFAVWVRRTLLEQILEAYAERLDALSRQRPTGAHRAATLAFCQDCAALAALPDLPETGIAAGLLLLGAVPVVVGSGPQAGLPPETVARFETARAARWLPDAEAKTLAQSLQLASAFVPDLGEGLLQRLRAEVHAVFDAAIPDPEAPIPAPGFARFVQTVADKPAPWRAVAVPLLVELCRTSALALVAAEAFAEYPEQAERFVRKGLSLDAQGTAFLLHAAAFLEEAGDAAALAGVRARLAGLETSVSEAAHARWTARHAALWEDYRWFRPQSDTAQTGPELVALDARIHAHGRSLLPPAGSPQRAAAEAELCDLGRFPSKGLARYVGWLREEERFSDAVDLIASLAEDLDGCVLRHRSSAWDFEEVVWRGLSCFLDSQDPAHITQGQAIVAALGSRITGWYNGDVLYTFACLAARADQPEQALHFLRWKLVLDAHDGPPDTLDLSWLQVCEGRDARVVALGGSAVEQRMWGIRSDEDFRTLWDHPGLAALEAAAEART